MPKSWFSNHARNMLEERIAATDEYVCELLDAGACVPVGREKGSNKIHYLFWSEKDGKCFVAVQDERNREIVTLLPTQYQNRFKMSCGIEMWARQLAENLKREPSSGSPLPMVHVKCIIVHGSKRRIIIFKLNGEEYLDSYPTIRSGSRNKNLDNTIKEFLARELKEGEHCTFILTRWGGSGLWTSYEF